jgi:hypothetical protein
VVRSLDDAALADAAATLSMPAGSGRGRLAHGPAGATAAYEPIRLSRQQQHELGQWMQEAGVLSSEPPLSEVTIDEDVVWQSPPPPQAAAPTEFALELQLSAVRLRLTTQGGAGDGGGGDGGGGDGGPRQLRAICLDLADVTLSQTSDLEGSAATQLRVGSLAVSARLDDSGASARAALAGGGAARGGTPPPSPPSSWEWESGELRQRAEFTLVSPLNPATADGVATLSLSLESWPATLGEWRAGGGGLRASREAGSHLSVRVVPLSVHVLPAAVLGVQMLAGRCAGAVGAPCAPLLPEPSVANSTVALSLGASLVLLPHEDHVLELDLGPLDVELRSPALEELGEPDGGYGGGCGGDGGGAGMAPGWPPRAAPTAAPSLSSQRALEASSAADVAAADTVGTVAARRHR